MNATTNAREFGVRYFVAQTLKTRSFGHTYVHVGAPWSFEHNGIEFTVSSYGRSAEGGGHKHKVHARCDGKPVLTKKLRLL